MGHYPKFASLLSEYLRQADRNQTWLANRLGVKSSTVGRWLSGETRPQTPEVIARIADCLSILDAERRTALLIAAGYGANVVQKVSEPVLPPSSSVASAISHVIARAPDWVVVPALENVAVYRSMQWTNSWEESEGLFPPTCGRQFINLRQSRLSISTALGNYFTGLLEQPNLFVHWEGQLQVPVPRGLERWPAWERIGWALHNPRGPRTIIFAADAGMGKSTLAARLIRCQREQNDFDLLVGDSAKTHQINPVTGAISPTDSSIVDTLSFLNRIRAQLGLPLASRLSTSDIVDRLAGRRTLMVLDNLDTISERSELFYTLRSLLGRDVRCIVTTRTVDALPELSFRALVVHLRPLATHDDLRQFIAWHVDRFSAEYPALRQVAVHMLTREQLDALLRHAAGVPLLVQLMFSTVARLSWSYLGTLPNQQGMELLEYLFAERISELGLSPAGRDGLELLRYVAIRQEKGEVVTTSVIVRWAQDTISPSRLPDALDRLYERFLLIKHDEQEGRFVLAPPLQDYLERTRE